MELRGGARMSACKSGHAYGHVLCQKSLNRISARLTVILLIVFHYRKREPAGREYGRRRHRRSRHWRIDARACAAAARLSLPDLRIGRRDQADRRRHQPAPARHKELAALGLEQSLASVAIETTDATFFNRFGQLIYQEPLGRAAGYEHPQFSIHRGDLQMVLLEVFRARAESDRLKASHH